jgi:hypothetical protein
MNKGQKSLSINETFIIDAENDGTMSACTGFFTNSLISCTGNTQILLGQDLVSVNLALSATTFFGDGSNLTGISTQDTFVTGGTYSAGTAVFTNNTGGTFSVSGFPEKTSDLINDGEDGENPYITNQDNIPIELVLSLNDLNLVEFGSDEEMNLALKNYFANNNLVINEEQIYDIKIVSISNIEPLLFNFRYVFRDRYANDILSIPKYNIYPYYLKVKNVLYQLNDSFDYTDNPSVFVEDFNTLLSTIPGLNGSTLFLNNDKNLVIDFKVDLNFFNGNFEFYNQHVNNTQLSKVRVTKLNDTEVELKYFFSYDYFITDDFVFNEIDNIFYESSRELRRSIGNVGEVLDLSLIYPINEFLDE